jgi:hypothetical protein
MDGGPDFGFYDPALHGTQQQQAGQSTMQSGLQRRQFDHTQLPDCLQLAEALGSMSLASSSFHSDLESLFDGSIDGGIGGVEAFEFGTPESDGTVRGMSL